MSMPEHFIPVTLVHLSKHDIADVHAYAEAYARKALEKASQHWRCATHGPGKISGWGCPECVWVMRNELAVLRAAALALMDAIDHCYEDSPERAGTATALAAILNGQPDPTEGL